MPSLINAMYWWQTNAYDGKTLITDESLISFDDDCCCCWEASDNFNRSDSTNVGNDWIECDSEWEIKDNQLRTTEAGLIVWTVAPASAYVDPSTRLGIFTVKIMNLVDGAHYRLHAFYSDLCELYYGWICADLIINEVSPGVFTGTIDILSESGVSSGAQTNSIVNGTEFILCIGRTNATARISTSTYPVRLACRAEDYVPDDYATGTGSFKPPDPGPIPYETGTGTYNSSPIFFAIENVTATEAIFDDAYQQDHYDNNIKCPACGCNCEGKCMPFTLTLTLTNALYCTTLDGQEFILTASGPCSWVSDVWSCPPYLNVFWSLTPVSSWVNELGECLEWVLRLVRMSGGSDIISTTPTTCTCDPINLTYSNLYFISDDYSNRCCEGKFETVETPGCAKVPGYNLWFCLGYFNAVITE